MPKMVQREWSEVDLGLDLSKDGLRPGHVPLALRFRHLVLLDHTIEPTGHATEEGSVTAAHDATIVEAVPIHHIATGGPSMAAARTSAGPCCRKVELSPLADGIDNEGGR